MCSEFGRGRILRVTRKGRQGDKATGDSCNQRCYNSMCSQARKGTKRLHRDFYREKRSHCISTTCTAPTASACGTIHVEATARSSIELFNDDSLLGTNLVLFDLQFCLMGTTNRLWKNVAYWIVGTRELERLGGQL